MTVRAPEHRFTVTEAGGQYVGFFDNRRAARVFAQRYAVKWETLVLVLDWRRGRFKAVGP